MITNNSINTKEGELILDSHKLAYHHERVEEWENYGKITYKCRYGFNSCLGAIVHFVMQWFKNRKKDLI